MVNGGSPTEYYLSELVKGPFERFSLIDRWKGLPVVRDHAILQ